MNENQATHRVKQYLCQPSKKTFKQVYEVIELIVNILQEDFCEQMGLYVENEPIIGHILGRLGCCKQKTFSFIADEGLLFLRDLHRFERDFC